MGSSRNNNLQHQSMSLLRSVLQSQVTTSQLRRQLQRRSLSSFPEWRQLPKRSIMASPSKILLTVEDTGVVKNKPQTEEAATKVSELLQQNHENNHIYFNKNGFHNHIAHHLLTLYGVGAPVDVLERHYKDNSSYQRPIETEVDVSVEDLHSPETFSKCLGKQQYYMTFLVFFKEEMEAKGWENVVNEYFFSGGERADDLLGRLYSGFLHPIIHLGFGIEFKQPAIIAEALAQAATHTSWTGDYLLAVEALCKSSPDASPQPMPELLDAIKADPKLSKAAEWTDDNKIRDGILGRAKDEMLSYAAQWVVTPLNLEQKTAEMINAVTYFTAAAQHPPKQVKFDFYFMHCLNSSIFFPTFNKQSWLSTENKVRLLQWKGWLDLAMYASRRAPELLLEEVATYVPAKLEKGDGEWPGIFRRLWELEDDGHAIKLARAIRNGELVAGDIEDGRIKSFMWEKIGNMAVDSVEDEGEHWARSVGFDEAWAEYKDRPRQDQI